MMALFGGGACLFPRGLSRSQAALLHAPEEEARIFYSPGARLMLLP